MPVTDRQVAALRAQLAGRLDEHKRLVGQLDWNTEGAGYAALLDGAFFEAVDRRLGTQATDENIINFVADVRSRTDEAARDVDPGYAERLISAVLGRGGSFDDLDEKKATAAKLYMLVSFAADQEYDDAGLDEFLQEARKNADRLLG
jgi:hypothetical protein